MADEVASLKVRIDGDASGIQSAIEQTEAALNKLDGKQVSAGKSAGKAAEKAAKNWEKAGRDIKSVGEGIDTITKPLQRSADILASGGVAAAKFAIDFEDSFAAVKKTVEGTPEQLEEVKNSIIDMSTVGINGHNAIPLTTAQLNELAAAGGQLGIATENIPQFTETMAMLGTATNLVGEQGAQTLARFMNVTNTSQDKVSNLGSAIVDLGNNFATTEAEIADMAMEMGATGSVVNISAQDVLAYATALSSLGVDAAAGGSSVSRIWMEIQNAVSAGGAKLQSFADISGKSSKEFADNWKNDASGAFADFLKGLGQSGDQVGVLGALGFNNIRDIKALQLLAGDRGIELLTDALERSNSAWEENTALMNEFNAKADTTASKIQIAKNNLVEAGRSIGESFLPMISDGAVNVAEFAKKIANMSDGQKQTLLTTGKWVIGLGALSKGTAGAVKGVGGLVEAYGKIKTAASAGGVLAKLAPALTTAGAAAPYAAAGIAAVAAAVVIGKKSYDAWYDSQYRWTKGLSEGNEKIRESMDKLKGITELKGELKAAKLIIENPESSKEELEQAKKKIEEIKKLLEEKYNLVINSDNSNLDEAVEHVEKLTKNELRENVLSQSDRLENLKPKFDEYNTDISGLQEQYSAALKLQEAYSDARAALSDYQFTAKEGESPAAAATRRLQEQRELVSGFFKDIEGGEKHLGKMLASNGSSVVGAIDDGFKSAGKKVSSLSKDIKNLEGSYKEYKAISTEMANWDTELLGIAALEGDAETVNQILPRMGKTIRDAGLDMHGYAIAAAEAMNGQDSLKKAWESAGKGDGTALTNIINDYVRASKEFGASAQQTATGAALLKNGFKSVSEAAEAGKLDVVNQQANEIADTMDELKGFNIEINANGDISLIDEADGKVKELQTAGGVTVKVDADGNVSVLDSATGKLQTLSGIGDVHFQVNADGNIDILNEADELIATVDKTAGTITVNGDYQGAAEIQQAIDQQSNLDDKEVKQTVTGEYNGKEDIDAALTAQNSLKSKSVTYTVNYVQNGTLPPSPFGVAKGTSDFAGGLAMINDQKGISDPRELVEIGGKGYIFEGRDVVLPLPEHSRVYTAAQTKEIMAGAGIPHYAKGKKNKTKTKEELWDDDRNAWQHRQKTAIVPLTAQDTFAWIDEMRKKYAGCIEALSDLDEEYASAVKQKWDEDLDQYKYMLDMGQIDTEQYYNELEWYRNEYVESGSEAFKKLSLELKKHREEQKEQQKEELKTANETSKAWIDVRNGFNDWDEVGDSITDAYRRIEERNRAALEAGLIDYEEYKETMLDTTEQLISGKAQYSYDWIEKQKQFWGMTSDEELAALKRVADTTEEYFASLGALTDEQYLIKLKLEADNEAKYWAGIDNRISEMEDSQEWYRRQSEVYGWGFDGAHKSESDYWQSVIDNYQNQLDNGGLNKTQYNAVMRKRDEAVLNLYTAQQKEFDDILSEQKNAISDLESAFSKELSALRETWSAEDRAEDMEEVRDKLDIYKNAATKEGREEYERLQDELKQLEREELAYQMEQENNAILEKLNAEYAETEAQQKEILENMYKDSQSLLNTNLDITTFTGNVDKQTERIEGKIDAVQKIIDNLGEIAKQREINVKQTFNNVLSDNVDSNALALKVKRSVASLYGGGH